MSPYSCDVIVIHNNSNSFGSLTYIVATWLLDGKASFVYIASLYNT